ncbi:hypothetical protein Hypma_003017 [Hypsizygus marmoreus]|uniref:WSC domain-containing protein n=1 Tax=Hypsizygus marmoreus TaxID=39966 RepID=A0A369JA41_HYPMA|nr:hypothetical protein Hypma_003017 [Hypsizygus marmoreus]
MLHLIFGLLAYLQLAAAVAQPRPIEPVQPRQSIPPHLPGNWSAVASGCYSDSQTFRTLRGAAKTDEVGMTVESCIAFCDDLGFVWAGVEYGKECYCGNLVAYGNPTFLAECNQPCTGNPAQSCGAAFRMNLFWKGILPPSSPATIGNSLWRFEGCFRDTVSVRTLPFRASTSGPTTPASCANACRDAGMPYMGLEYGFECWCGQTLSQTLLVSTYECDTVCTNDHAHVCGADNRLTVYRHDALPPVTYPTGCTSVASPRFRLSSKYKEPPVEGPEQFQLKVVEAYSAGAGIGWSVLSACTTCTSPWDYLIYSPENNVLVTQSFSTSAPPIQVSVTLWDGESPVFQTKSTLPPDYGGYAGYCETTNPYTGNGPHLLRGNGDVDKWALCRNNTADGRLDVVLKPRTGHPHYDTRDCGAIDIRITGA